MSALADSVRVALLRLFATAAFALVGCGMGLAQTATVNPDGTITFSDSDDNNGGEHWRDEASASGRGAGEQVPVGLYVWRIEERFGDIRPAAVDTMPEAFPNVNLTDGLKGHYNFTGNLGAPRQSRLFTEQPSSMWDNPFIFRQPYNFFIPSVGAFHFTNTKSPIANLSYHKSGNRTNGEDRFTALFGVNAGKKFGMGFKIDYLYGRGYYDSQSTSEFDGTFYASYLSDHYKLHLLYSGNHMKMAENGGIEEDSYVTNPEAYEETYGTGDIPTRLTRAWNRMNVHTLYLNHKYSLGFDHYLDTNGAPVVLRANNEQTLAFIVRAIGLPDSLAADSAFVNNLLATAHMEEAPLSAQQMISQRNDRPAGDAPAQRPEGEPAPQAQDIGGSALPPEADTAKKAAIYVPTLRDTLQRAWAAYVRDSMELEFVPVVSFIHTARIDRNTRNFISNYSASADAPYYFNDYYLDGDSADDKTSALNFANTLAIELHEGFNKWMQTGMRLFARHELQHYTLPDENKVEQSYNYNYFTVGAQLLRDQKIFQYHVLGELRTTGSNWGEFNVEGDLSLAVPLGKKTDSLRVEAHGFARNQEPSFYYNHYHARNAWWNNDYSKEFRTNVGGSVRWRDLSIGVNVENIRNYTYLQERQTIVDGTAFYSVSAAQASSNIQLVSATLSHDLRWGIFHWDNELTYQASSDKDLYPVPSFMAYSNMYLLFRMGIGKVLRVELGADVRYFTRYYANAYSPIVGMYCVQDPDQRIKLGNYPWMNVYVNLHLKHTRFYIMGTHVNYSSGSGMPFLVPHYPTNRTVVRFGLSWNFFN